MKIHSNTYRIFTFLIILIFCAIPPIFTKAPEVITFVEWTFPLRQICYAIFAGLLLYLSRDLLEQVLPPLNKQLFFSLITLILLILVSLGIRLIADFIGETSAIEVQKPCEFLPVVFCVLNFISSAFYEEVIYRFFIPETIGKILRGVVHQSDSGIWGRSNHQSDGGILGVAGQKSGSGIWGRFDLTDFLCDFVSLILFALGHLYLGFFSVLNAAAAYAILRFCFKRTKNIFTGTASHFAYNLIQLFVSPF